MIGEGGGREGEGGGREGEGERIKINIEIVNLL